MSAAEREKLRAETERFRQEMRWEPLKALAARTSVRKASSSAGLTPLAAWPGACPVDAAIQCPWPYGARPGPLSPN